jgi:hypothetical protein
MANRASGKRRFTEGPILDAPRLLVKNHTAAVARARWLHTGKIDAPSGRRGRRTAPFLCELLLSTAHRWGPGIPS